MSLNIRLSDSRYTLICTYAGRVDDQQLDGAFAHIRDHAMKKHCSVIINMTDAIIPQHLSNKNITVAIELMQIPSLKHVVFVIPGASEHPLSGRLRLFFEQYNAGHKLHFAPDCAAAERITKNYK